MRGSLAIAVALLATSCTSATGTTTTQAPGPPCEGPPATELDAASTLEMAVAPNPAQPLQTVALSVSSAGLPEDTVAGIDARWQCWDGSEWMTTHLVYRGFGDNPGQTIALNTDFQISVPSIGLALDQGFPIVIPRVEPGTYRIADEIIVDGEPIPGFAIVEVVEG